MLQITYRFYCKAHDVDLQGDPFFSGVLPARPVRWQIDLSDMTCPRYDQLTEEDPQHIGDLCNQYWEIWTVSSEIT